jgi:hypothetical protein
MRISSANAAGPSASAAKLHPMPEILIVGRKFVA